MSKLRDYKVIFASTATQELALDVEGDNIYIKNILIRSSTAQNVDYTVRCEFDDQGKLHLRPREGARRPYTRVKFTIVDDTDTPVNIPSTVELNVTLGVGTLFSERDDGAIPDKMGTATLALAGAGAETTLTGFPNRVEMRLCIPSTEANGVFYGYKTGEAFAWLEKGVTEWLTYCGDLVFRNTGAAVNITIASIYRKD